PKAAPLEPASADGSCPWAGSTQFLDPGLSRGHRANPRCRRHDLLVATPRGADDLCPLRLQADTVHFGANTRCRTGTHTMALKVFRRAWYFCG
uniref:Uncharacterized protein n=1 Tax=Aegilops tauschii subsp. strangulata TaxID=200361 RepID=A0A453BFW9_AEGTS